ncbi:MAG: nucleotidyltransferase domain-containing protein [Candidatus Magasanikbacteria bacterium]|nr:nucleotidyltransferase domain-containing protein [Candidatus Magasanikbacteria bacterium]
MDLKFDAKKLSRVARQNDLKFVILHGSYAAGKTRPDSDVDIAVLAHQKLPFDKYMSLQGKLGEIFEDYQNHPERDLDLKDAYGVDPFFRYEIVRGGKLLYGNPAAYEEFKAGALRAYEDAAPLFALEHALIGKYQKHLNQLALQYA